VFWRSWLLPEWFEMICGISKSSGKSSWRLYFFSRSLVSLRPYLSNNASVSRASSFDAAWLVFLNWLVVASGPALESNYFWVFKNCTTSLSIFRLSKDSSSASKSPLTPDFGK
jgi:hypothetical protein